MKEIWKDVNGYEGKYQVSNFGRIKSKNRVVKAENGKKFHFKTRILKPNHAPTYPQICFFKDKHKKFFLIHRLVAKLFIPNPENKPQVNHIDGNKLNNTVENLEWCTASENIIHAFEQGLRSKPNPNVNGKLSGEKHPSSKLNNLQIRIIRRVGRQIPSRKVAKIFNVCPTSIKNIINRKSWSHI